MNTRVFILLYNKAPGRVVVQFNEPSNTPGYKDTGEKLLGALGARHSHRHGYTLSPTRAEAFSLLYKAGWSGFKNPFGKGPASFSLPNGPCMRLSEALKLARLGQAE